MLSRSTALTRRIPLLSSAQRATTKSTDLLPGLNPFSTMSSDCKEAETLESSPESMSKRKSSPKFEEGLITQPDSNEKSNSPKRPKKADKDDIKRNYTWQIHPDGRDPHAGSYANPAMRELFGVQLPSKPLLQVEQGDALDGKTNELLEKKRTKRKVAFLLGYLGTNFVGFQINQGQRTLQAEFELALLRCRMLDTRNFGYPNKYGWSTSGRTDKGVHACAQVCSAKIELLPEQTLDQVREELNAVLPQEFRVLDAVKTTRSFCARTQRDRVRYQYMIPSFLLLDANSVRQIFEKVGAVPSTRNPSDPLSPEEIKKIQSELRSFRVAPKQLEKLKEALSEYEGTHSFHAFTKGVKVDEARARRFIVSFRVEDPIVFENGIEWIPTQVLGQSFLLHQIRKMVCMAIEVGRGVATVQTIRRAFELDDAIRVGLAPAEGLFLDMSYYSGYNKRKEKNPTLEDIDWTREDSPVFRRWKDFRDGTIMKHVVSEEEKVGNFVKFLFLQEYFFEREEAYDPDRHSEHRQVARNNADKSSTSSIE